MENLKIKVNTAEESKEVQELLFELGYKWHGKGKTVSYLNDVTNGGFGYLVAWSTGFFTNVIQMGCGSEDAKETTIAELRAMVEPKMKEYLMPNRNYEYILTDAREGLEPHAKDWISIPDKYNFLYVGTRGDRAWTSEPANCYGELVWQRPTQPEALPFIDDNPQSLNEQYAEIEEVRQAVKVKSGSDSDHMADAMSYGFMGGIDATLAERQSTYGNFEDVAFVTENIMSVLGRVRVNGLSELPNTHRMALYMIASKMARIVNGDFNHLDSWHDIGGYAKLIEGLVKENNNG